MKKLSIVLSIVLLSAIIIGCGAPAPVSSPTPTTTSATTAPAPAAPKPAAPQAPTAPAPTSAPAAPVPSPTAKPAVSPTPTAVLTPQYGGNLIFLQNMGMTKLGAPADNLPEGLRPTIPAFDILLKRDWQENIFCDEDTLTESYTLSPDGKILTLNLRKGIKFHDGTPFNAEAVKYNLERDLAAGISGSAVLKNVDSYTVVDENTLRLNLKQFNVMLMLQLASANLGLIASPTAMKKPVTGDTMAKEHVVGTGPFIFDSWKRDTYARYKKNPDYWQKGKPYVDTMEIRVNSDVAVSILSFKAKEAQWVDNIDAVDAAQLQKEGYNVQLVGLWFVHGLVPDTTNPDSPYQDPKVRMAVEYALDRETMAQIGKGFYKAPYQVAGPEYAWYNPSLTPRKYDPAKAKQLLAQAGYPKGFTYPLYTDVRQRKDFMVAVQTYLKEAGIDAPLEVADVAKATSWQYTTGWKGLFMQGGGNFTQTLISYDTNLMNPTNWVSFKRPQGWQDMWSTVVSEPDHDKRYAKMSQMVKILYDEALVIPYQYDTPIYVTSNNLHDVRWQQGGIGHWWDCSSVWLSK